jgi:1-phosphofructokinase
MICALGGESIAMGFAGGGSGKELLSLVAKKGLRSDFVQIAAVTRTNLKVIDNDGALTEFNEPGPHINGDEWGALEQKLAGLAVKGNTVVLSGSLPAGLGKDTYKKLSAMLRQKGASVFLDADGDAFRLALENGPDAIPDYIKPNRFELLQYFGIADDHSIPDAKLAELCRSLLDKGIKLVALSMGADGAIFANKSGVWRSPALPAPVRSTVGAGDSMIGALAYGFANLLPDEQCFALAMAASAGACATEGTNPPDRAMVDKLLEQTQIKQIA